MTRYSNGANRERRLLAKLKIAIFLIFISLVVTALVFSSVYYSSYLTRSTFFINEQNKTVSLYTPLQLGWCGNDNIWFQFKNGCIIKVYGTIWKTDYYNQTSYMVKLNLTKEQQIDDIMWQTNQSFFGNPIPLFVVPQNYTLACQALLKGV